MIIFGLVLLILAIVVIAYVWLATGGMSEISIDYGILNVELAPLWFFFAGGITLAVATSGLWLMGVGAKSSTRRAKEMRELRRQASDRDAKLDRDLAAHGSDQDRRGSTPTTAGTSAPTTAGTSTPTMAGTSTPAERTASNPEGGRQPILPRHGRDETHGAQGPTGGRVDPDR